MRKMIIITLMTITSNIGSGEIDVRKNLINKISHLKPNVDKVWANRFVNKILKYSKIYKVSPNTAINIAMAESSFRPDIVTYKNKKVLDVGLFQLNHRTIKEYKFDQQLIVKNLDYSVKTFMIVMADKKKMCSKKDLPWACYHSKTKKYKDAYVNKIRKIERSFANAQKNYR